MGDNVGYGWMNGWLAACCLHHTVSWGQPIGLCFLGLSDIQVKLFLANQIKREKHQRDNVRMLLLLLLLLMFLLAVLLVMNLKAKKNIECHNNLSRCLF